MSIMRWKHMTTFKWSCYTALRGCKIFTWWPHWKAQLLIKNKIAIKLGLLLSLVIKSPCVYFVWSVGCFQLILVAFISDLQSIVCVCAFSLACLHETNNLHKNIVLWVCLCFCHLLKVNVYQTVQSFFFF